LRIQDVDKTWRIVYRIDTDAILILDVFEKRTQTTPQTVLAICKRRLTLYDSLE
jgi:phage-related protein